MSRENVELTRRVFEAFNRRDFDAAFSVLDDSISWRTLVSAEAPVLQGKEALRRHWGSQVDAIDVHIDLEDLTPVGDSRVVAVARWRGRGTASGAPVGAHAAQLFTFERGKVVSVETYPSENEALEAAELASRDERG